MRGQNLRAAAKPALALRHKAYRLTIDFVFNTELTEEELSKGFFGALASNTLPQGRATIVECEARPFVGHIIEAVVLEQKVQGDATTLVDAVKETTSLTKADADERPNHE